MGEKNIQLHYIGTDSFVISINTEDFMKGLRNLEDSFHFSNLNEIHEIYSFETTTENPKKTWIEEFNCLGTKMYAFKSGDGSKNKSIGICKPQSKILDLMIKKDFRWK